MAKGGYMAKGGKLEVGVYRVGKPTKIKPNFYEQKIVEISLKIIPSFGKSGTSLIVPFSFSIKSMLKCQIWF